MAIAELSLTVGIEELGDTDRLSSLEGGEDACGMLRAWSQTLQQICNGKKN